MSVTLGILAQLCDGEINESLIEKTYNAITMDSRLVGTNDIFVALETEQNDGHNYVKQALEKGAVCAIVKRGHPLLSSDIYERVIAVENPLEAIQQMAKKFQRECAITPIAITGSSGKTTTRLLVAQMLKSQYNVGETKSNWNNHIGVPLSILSFSGDEDFSVLELGANHVGEINDLSYIAQPEVSIIANIGYAHVGLFGGIDNTTKAKFEIVNGMPQDKRLVLLNGDDERLVNFTLDDSYDIISFGFSSQCEYRAVNVVIDSENERTRFDVNGHKFELSMLGEHFIYSSLPAIILADKYTIPYEKQFEVIKNFKPGDMRGNIERKDGITFILDCYNANPSSMKAGVKLLKNVANSQRTCAVVGDMLELEEYSESLHRELGIYLKESSIDLVIAVGEFAQTIADGALSQGYPQDQIYVTTDHQSATDCAQRVLQKGDVVLLKGSRRVGLEEVFNNFTFSEGSNS